MTLHHFKQKLRKYLKQTNLCNVVHHMLSEDNVTRKLFSRAPTDTSQSFQISNPLSNRYDLQVMVNKAQACSSNVPCQHWAEIELKGRLRDHGPLAEPSHQKSHDTRHAQRPSRGFLEVTDPKSTGTTCSIPIGQRSLRECPMPGSRDHLQAANCCTIRQAYCNSHRHRGPRPTN